MNFFLKESFSRTLKLKKTYIAVRFYFTKSYSTVFGRSTFVLIEHFVHIIRYKVHFQVGFSNIYYRSNLII